MSHKLSVSSPQLLHCEVVSMVNIQNTRCAQRIHAATFAKNMRAIGISAVETEAGSGGLARDIAVTTAGFGKRVMLINAREMSEFGITGNTAAAFMKGAIASNEGFLDVRIIRGSNAHRTINNAQQLSQLLLELAETVDAIIIDLPAHDEPMPAVYAPITAVAMDAVFLAAMPSLTTALQLGEAISWLTESGAIIAAIVVNDRFNPVLGDEIIREAKRLTRFFPFFPRFIERLVANSPALNRYH